VRRASAPQTKTEKKSILFEQFLQKISEKEKCPNYEMRMKQTRSCDVTCIADTDRQTCPSSPTAYCRAYACAHETDPHCSLAVVWVVATHVRRPGKWLESLSSRTSVSSRALMRRSCSTSRICLTKPFLASFLVYWVYTCVFLQVFSCAFAHFCPCNTHQRSIFNMRPRCTSIRQRGVHFSYMRYEK
jgi:hypothetical protein